MKTPANKPPDSPFAPLLQPGGLSRELTRVALLAFAMVSAWKLAHQLVDLLLMFAMVFLLAIILNSVVVALQKRGMKRGVAVLLIMLGFLGCATLGGFLIVPPALQQADQLVTRAPEYWKNIRERATALEEQYPALKGILPSESQQEFGAGNAPADASTGSGTPGGGPTGGGTPGVAPDPGPGEALATQSLTGFLDQSALLGYAKSAVAITATLAGAVFIVVLSFLVLIFTLANPQALVGGLLGVTPVSHREAARRSLARIFMQMTGWARATLLNGTITGVLTGAGLAIAGVQPALVFGICAFFGEFVPNVGPLVAAAPAIFVAISMGPAKAVAALGVIIFVQAVASNAINPLIMGREMKLHPVSITFFALSMGKLFGVAGAILAVPTAATTKILIEEFYLRPRGVEQEGVDDMAREIVMSESGVEEPDL